MVMRHAVLVLTLLGVVLAVPARSQTSNGGLPRGACLSSAESRDLFVADKLAPPFRVMKESARLAQAEAIDIQLCRAQGGLVYDVTLLDPQGRVSHRLVDATTGAVRPVAPAEGRPAAPRPFAQGPRPPPNDYPGGPGLFGGPRFHPNFFQGSRVGPYMFQGQRAVGPFFPGMRPFDRNP